MKTSTRYTLIAICGALAALSALSLGSIIASVIGFGRHLLQAGIHSAAAHVSPWALLVPAGMITAALVPFSVKGGMGSALRTSGDRTLFITAAAAAAIATVWLYAAVLIKYFGQPPYAWLWIGLLSLVVWAATFAVLHRLSDRLEFSRR
jgi:hypothetical protein